MLLHVGVPIEHRLLCTIVIDHLARPHVRPHVFDPQFYFLGRYVPVRQEESRDLDQVFGEIPIYHIRWS